MDPNLREILDIARDMATEAEPAMRSVLRSLVERVEQLQATRAEADQYRAALQRIARGYDDATPRWNDTNVELRRIATDALAALPLPNARWIPVMERLPPMGERVDVWSNGRRFADASRQDVGDVWLWADSWGDCETFADYQPSHWMPLPAAPEVR